ncbi:class I SAM-dependent methyltransferase [Saccharothrix sp. NPDC042600]|uniref:class I SAM-dependent methyltransferase n=1 Tax=Saccharothrix TaxID=2071 RepID=UPI0034098297|nr:class I SAM-dependent methyltransferase [Saccharothrix mutabilis subsp. capreolus]
MTTLDPATAVALRRGWDAQQQPFLPWREEAFDVLAARARGRVLDLAGGTGSIAARLTGVQPVGVTPVGVTLLDFDPVLLEIARVALGVPVVRGDLSGPGWADGLPRFDSVVAGTALHHFGPERLRALYAEIHEVLAPGGLFANADRMPEPAAAAAGESASDESGSDESGSGGSAAMGAWHSWWREALAQPALAAAAADRADGESADFYPPAAWHVEALGSAGFAHVEVVWRRGDSAVVVAHRDPLI